MTTQAKKMMTTHQSTGRNWGLFFAGILVVLSGLVFLFWPGLTLVAITQIAGVLLIIGGIMDFVSYYQDKKIGAQSGWTIVNGICCILLGILFLVHPIVTASVIPFLVGIFVLFYSIISIVAAINLRGLGPIWGFMLANGIVSLLCGIMFIAMPATFVIFLGVFMIMRGITMCVYGATASTPATMF